MLLMNVMSAVMSFMTDPIEKRLHELRETAKAYAKAESERVYLVEYRKSKLAILMKKFVRTESTAAGQEREARAHPEYLELLEGLKVATEEAERCKWELNIARLGSELWRTQQATQRAERKGYGL
jgi:hypothetical protein